MANIKVGLSKKSTVILLMLFFLVLGGGGGYLLWRVNQAKTVAPTDSDASVPKMCRRCTKCNKDRNPDGNCYGNSSGEWVGCTKDDGTDGCCAWSDTEEYECGVKKYHITYVAGANGSVSKKGQNEVDPGGSISSTATPNDGFKFTKWSDGNTSATRTDSNVLADATYTANFEKLPDETFTLKYTAGPEGKITGTATQTVKKGASGTAVTATPNNATTHEFDKWSDGKTANPRTDTNVQGNITVNATFKAKTAETYTLKYTVQPAGSGTIQGKATQTVKKGGNGEKVTAVPNSGYKFVGWGGEDGLKTPERQDTNVQKNITAIAMFQKEGVPVEKVTLTYKAGTGGKIEGGTTQTINKGTSGTKVTAKANNGYKFDKWAESPTGKTQAIVSMMIPDNGLQSSRVDTAVQANVTITASFKKSCGDSMCDSWENMQNCPADCEGCGDGVCADGETPQTCSQDCSAVCGDGMCTEGESSENCPTDCGAPVVSETVPETGLFDETGNILIMGGILLALGMGWTWVSTLPKKAYVTISDTVSEAKSKSVVRERESRRRKLEERIK